MEFFFYICSNQIKPPNCEIKMLKSVFLYVAAYKIVYSTNLHILDVCFFYEFLPLHSEIK